MLQSNEQFIDLEFKFKRNIGLAKAALEQEALIPKFYPQYDPYVIQTKEIEQYCDSILVEMGIKNFPCCEFNLYVYKSCEVNAYCTPTEKGFAILLPLGIVFNNYFDDKMIMGLIAHEFVHGVLRHIARQFFQEKKKERQTKTMAGIAISLNGIGEGVDSYNAYMTGQYKSQLAYILDEIIRDTRTETKNKEIIEKGNKEILKYHFQYSKELEFEADLIAYRFMDYISSGENYINALRAVGQLRPETNNENGEHPSTQKRIEFLRYAKLHPEIGNTLNQVLYRSNRLKEASENK